MAFFDKLGEFGQGFAQGFSSTLPTILDERRRRKWREEDQGLRQVETLKRDFANGSDEAGLQLADLNPEAFDNVYSQRDKNYQNQTSALGTTLNSSLSDIDRVLGADINDIDPQDVRLAISQIGQAKTYLEQLNTVGGQYDSMASTGGRLGGSWQSQHTVESLNDTLESLHARASDVRHHNAMFADLIARRDAAWLSFDKEGWMATQNSMYKRGHLDRAQKDSAAAEGDRHFLRGSINQIGKFNPRQALQMAIKEGFPHLVDMYSAMVDGQTYSGELDRFNRMLVRDEYAGALELVERSNSAEMVSQKAGLLSDLFSSQQSYFAKRQQAFHEAIDRGVGTLAVLEMRIAAGGEQTGLPIYEDSTGRILEGGTLAAIADGRKAKTLEELKNDVRNNAAATQWKVESERYEIIKASGGSVANISAALLENFRLSLEAHLDMKRTDAGFNEAVQERDMAEMFRDKIVGLDALTFREKNEIVRELMASYQIEEESFIPGVGIRSVTPDEETGRLSVSVGQPSTSLWDRGVSDPKELQTAEELFDLFGEPDPFVSQEIAATQYEEGIDPEEYQLIRPDHASTRQQHKALYEWVDQKIVTGIETIGGVPDFDESDKKRLRDAARKGKGLRPEDLRRNKTNQYLSQVQAELLQGIARGHLSPAANIEQILAAIEANITTPGFLKKGERFHPWDMGEARPEKYYGIQPPPSDEREIDPETVGLLGY